MGILNITPDSFSDGGSFLDPDRAVDHALMMLEDGADLLDLGTESTRPGGGVYGHGAASVPWKEELARLLPVLNKLRPLTEAPLSVDTRKSRVARHALDAGADLINDVSSLADDEMAPLLAERQVPVVLMHSRGDWETMQTDIHFERVVTEVRDEIEEAIARAVAGGIKREQILIDPGIGFGKTAAQNLLLLRHLDHFADLGQPILVGASRKSFIGEVGGGSTPDRRLGGSLAAALFCRTNGAQVIRVHDVAETVQFLNVWSAIEDVTEIPA